MACCRRYPSHRRDCFTFQSRRLPDNVTAFEKVIGYYAPLPTRRAALSVVHCEQRKFKCTLSRLHQVHTFQGSGGDGGTGGSSHHASSTNT
jgi:hypothetical protein